MPRLELLTPMLQAYEDLDFGAPTAAEVRVAAAQEVLFLSGISRSEIEELTVKAQTEALLLKVELGSL